jgi:co-chaperonin GroES (HSP10)
MKVHYHPDIQTKIENIRPIGDFVLVKRLPDEEETVGGLLIPSRYRNEDRPRNPRQSIRRGVIVAAGPGDKGLLWKCGACGVEKFMAPSGKQYKGEDYMTYAIRSRCECGKRDWTPVADVKAYANMDATVGDIVLYQRWENNIVRINNEEYTLLHEQSQVIAVEERAAA